MNFFDTSIFVAAAQTRHLSYQPCVELLRDARHDNTCCALHSLAETFSILSGMPRPFKLSPDAALHIVEQARERTRIVTLNEKEYSATIASLVEAGHSGGIVYDALLMACARKANAERIFTLNGRHFKTVAPDLAPRIFIP